MNLKNILCTEERRQKQACMPYQGRETFSVKRSDNEYVGGGGRGRQCLLQPLNPVDAAGKQLETTPKPMSMAPCQENYSWTLKMEFHTLFMTHKISFSWFSFQLCKNLKAILHSRVIQKEVIFGPKTIVSCPPTLYVFIYKEVKNRHN